MNRREKFIEHMRVNAARTKDMMAKRYINKHIANASIMSAEEFAEYEMNLADIAVKYARFGVNKLTVEIRAYVDQVYTAQS